MFVVGYLAQVICSKAITFMRTPTSGRLSVLTTCYNTPFYGDRKTDWKERRKKQLVKKRKHDEIVCVWKAGELTWNEYCKQEKSIEHRRQDLAKLMVRETQTKMLLLFV